MKDLYFYGMTLRGFSPGCQPMEGLVDWLEDKHNNYHNILIYDRYLEEKEVENYELEFIDKVDYQKIFSKWFLYLKEEFPEAEEELIQDYIDKAIRECVRDVMIVCEWLQVELS